MARSTSGSGNCFNANFITNVALLSFILLFIYVRKDIEYLLEDLSQAHDAFPTFLPDGGADKNQPLVWITTNEGLISRYFQLERIYDAVSQTDRELHVVDTTSGHYVDLDHPIGEHSICEVFALPAAVKCIQVHPNSVVLTKSCLFPKSALYQESGVKEWTDGVTAYGIRRQYDRLVDRRSSFNVNKTQCLIDWGFYWPQVESPTDIKFSRRFLPLLDHARSSLCQMHGSGTGSHCNFAAVHFRRGDQLQYRCGISDASVNCAQTSDELVQIVNKGVDEWQRSLGAVSSPPKPKRTRPPIVYVATNEKDPIMLANITAAGYKLFSDLDLHSMSALDAFVIELLLLIEADHFMGWGDTNIGTFVRRVRTQVSAF
jgi:hypothetical protein